ncbi:MAG: dethiobiotin synthase, partial [Microcoleaceae cyanobacterium]
INDLTPINLIESLTQVPVLGIMPYLPDFKDLSKLATNASQLDLEKFFL